MRGKRGTAAFATLVGYLILASTAFASDSSVHGYGGSGGEVSAGLGGGGVGGTDAGSSLPFTGLDLLFILMAGGVLILMGLTLRLFGRARA
jgi:hypothetical protein